MVELKKPEMKTISFWVYREVINYIERKYNIETRGYTPKAGFTPEELKNGRKPYLDFWHWLVDRHEIHNGCQFTLWYEPEDEETPEWVKEILKMIFDEFEPGYGEIDLCVSW